MTSSKSRSSRDRCKVHIFDAKTVSVWGKLRARPRHHAASPPTAPRSWAGSSSASRARPRLRPRSRRRVSAFRGKPGRSAEHCRAPRPTHDRPSHRDRRRSRRNLVRRTLGLTSDASHLWALLARDPVCHRRRCGGGCASTGSLSSTLKCTRPRSCRLARWGQVSNVRVQGQITGA
jgi:hypothetical protein